MLQKCAKLSFSCGLIHGAPNAPAGEGALIVQHRVTGCCGGLQDPLPRCGGLLQTPNVRPLSFTRQAVADRDLTEQRWERGEYLLLAAGGRGWGSVGSTGRSLYWSA